MNIHDYDTYLFDWDGTLARTTEMWLEATKTVLVNQGITVSDSENIRRLGNFDWLANLGLTDEQVHLLADTISRIVSQRLSDVLLYEDVPRLLTVLRGCGKRVALVTTSSLELVDDVMNRHNIHEHFDVVVTGDDVQHVKPSPEGVLLALSRLGAAPERTIMLGDTRNDILAAHSAGIHSALFYPDSHQLHHNLQELLNHAPTYTIHSWHELIDQVQSEA